MAMTDPQRTPQLVRAQTTVQTRQIASSYLSDEISAREEEPALLRYYRVLMGRKWLLLAVTVTVVALSALQLFTTTRLYTAAARLQIDPEESKVLPYQSVVDEASLDWDGSYLATQVEKIQSAVVADRVSRRLDLASDPRRAIVVRNGVLSDTAASFKRWLRRLLQGGGTSTVASAPKTDGGEDGAEWVAGLPGSLAIVPVRNTRLIEVQFTSAHRELSADIVNTLGEEFIEQHLEEKYEATLQATEFLRNQLDDMKSSVEQTEGSLIGYAQEKNIVSVSDRDTVLRQKLADLSTQLTAAEGELIVAASANEAARSAGRDELPAVLETEGIRGLKNQLSGLQQQLAGLSTRYGPEWPAVKELSDKIAEVESQLEREQERVKQAAVAGYRLAHDRRDRLAQAVAQQQSLVERLDQDSIQYNILKRDVDTNKELYEGLLQRLKEAGISAGLRSSNIRVVERATVPTVPTSPQKGRGLMKALLLGLALGVGLVLLVDAVDNSVTTSEQLTETLGLPALGIVPSLGSGPVAWPQRLWAGKTETTGRELIALEALRGNGASLKGPSWEAYRSLRTAILLSHAGKPPQVLMVTSAMPSEGKTTTATNTAIALAQTGARTLLIELDMRRPVIADCFGLSREEGISTYLTGNTDLSSQIVQSGVDNLFVVPSGPTPPNPPELIGSDRMKTALRLLREYFAYIVIDMPPVLHLSDALVLAPEVDGIVLVARGGKTPRQAIRRSADALARVGGTLLGVVLNDVDVSKSAYGYYGYYRSGYDGYYGQDHS